MSEYIDIDQPLLFKDIYNRDVTGTIRTILKANHTELVLADVVPVVRCKDCRHRDPEDHKCDSGQPERQGCPLRVDDNYFCAYGER